MKKFDRNRKHSTLFFKDNKFLLFACFRVVLGGHLTQKLPGFVVLFIHSSSKGILLISILSRELFPYVQMLTSYEHFMDYLDDEQAPKKSVAHHG